MSGSVEKLQNYYFALHLEMIIEFIKRRLTRLGFFFKLNRFLLRKFNYPIHTAFPTSHL